MPHPGEASLRHIIVRILKGLYMTAMFAAFGGGLIFGFFVLPGYLLAERLKGRDPLRFHRLIRGFVGMWLRLLERGGLLRTGPSRGSALDGPCVVVANHPGLFDVLILIRDVPNMSVLAKQAIRTTLGLGPILRLAGYVSAESRSSAAVALETTGLVLDQIRQGMKFMLFPEGTRSPKGGLLPFKAGAFKLARTAHVPIQPVLIRNTPPFLPHEDRWYYPPYETSVIQLEFLEPISPPGEGQERRAAAGLEKQFRAALGLGYNTGQDDKERRIT